MIEDISVPGLPQVPKDQEDDVKPHIVRKRSTDSYMTRALHKATRHRETQSSPNIARPVAFREDVSIGFHHTSAKRAPRFLQGLDVSVVQVGVCVEAPTAKQPGKELDLSREFGGPNLHHVRSRRPFLHGSVRPPRAEINIVIDGEKSS